MHVNRFWNFTEEEGEGLILRVYSVFNQVSIHASPLIKFLDAMSSLYSSEGISFLLQVE